MRRRLRSLRELEEARNAIEGARARAAFLDRATSGLMSQPLDSPAGMQVLTDLLVPWASAGGGAWAVAPLRRRSVAAPGGR